MNIDTSFVPLELDGTSWSALEPLYISLRERTIDDAADLERLLLDRSELDAHVSEAGNRIYAAMTCDTTDEAIEAAYLKFVEEVSPPLQQIAFEIDQRWLIDLAGDRADLIDQAQSLNVFLPADTHKRDLH